MKFKLTSFYTKENLLLLLVAVLLLPALLTNLDLVAFYGDEGIRSLIALEMKISGNYLTPTLFGEFYYNKPPLYNWILLAVFELSGRSDEFTARCVTLFFLFLFAGTVYFFNKKLSPFGKKNRESKPVASPLPAAQYPVIAALALISCGRILFWDSMLALIDICFSWVMYLLFMVIFQQGEKERYGRLFAFAYLLAGIGFLLKGLPALVFLGISLPAYFIWQKKWKALFSLKHLAGGAAFLLLVGGYYFLYARHNGLETIFKTLFQESAKRTFVEYGIGQTALHLLTFPFEIGFHFLPWTLLALYFFQKNMRQRVRQNKFITWNIIVLLTTILPYWSSVEVYPRYLFMHVPLLFSVFFYLHFSFEKNGFDWKLIVESIFGVVCLLAALSSLLLPFWQEAQDVELSSLKIIFLFSSFSSLSWLYWKWKAQRLLVFVVAMLVARLGFDWFVLPSRVKIECSTQVRETTLKAAKALGNNPLYIYKNSLGLQPITGYYFTRETGRILFNRNEAVDTEARYIIHPNDFDKNIFEEIGRITIQWKCGELIIGRLKS